MASEPDTSPLVFQILPFIAEEKPRFIVQSRDTLEPLISLSIYEQYLNHKTTSHNTVKSTLTQLLYLFTWATLASIDLESLLLRGKFLSPIQIRQFAYWLSCRGTAKKNGVVKISISGFNNVLMHSCKIICWFARQYGTFKVGPEVNGELLINSQKQLFSGAKKKDRRVKSAPDLSEEEIYAIDQFLRPENRKDEPEEVAVRDFLFWRLSIEFGFREGEILALRLCDCPHRDRGYFKIVRVEERGSKYYDPRGAYAPRPKTLSRDLGFLFTSEIPSLLAIYTSKHRYKWVKRDGKSCKQFLLDHNFLMVSHQRTVGDPLSVSGLQEVAKKITKNIGIPFHWHLSRHAFFNRAYAAIVEIENKDERKAKLMDLVYWGGWSDEKSLQIYVNRARESRGQKALMLWQQGGNQWKALGL